VLVALDDGDLVIRHCQGDPRAFAELVQAYRARVFGYMRRCGIDPAACDDLFQDAFIRIHNAARTYQPGRPLKPWIFTIVVNVVRTYYRRERVRQLVRVTDEADKSTPSAEQTLEAAETGAVIALAMKALSFAEREVLLLSAVEQLEQKDIAEMLGMPVGTVKTHLHRARASLARALVRHALKAGSEVIG
jgi:RNA polymerase sigma-70 factor (ECF subfamily)